MIVDTKNFDTLEEDVYIIAELSISDTEVVAINFLFVEKGTCYRIDVTIPFGVNLEYVTQVQQMFDKLTTEKCLSVLEAYGTFVSDSVYVLGEGCNFESLANQDNPC